MPLGIGPHARRRVAGERSDRRPAKALDQLDERESGRDQQAGEDAEDEGADERDLDQHGVAIVGEIESGLPSLGLPETGVSDYLDVAPAAVGVMMIAFAEGLGAAKTYAAKEHYEIDPNRELIGLGAANIGSGLSSGMVVNGSLSKTAVNASAGAKSQLSGLVVAALTVVTLLFFTGLFEELPEASLAAVVSAALVELVDIRSLVDLDAETVPYIDVTAAGMLAELADDLERRGIGFFLARHIGQVRDVLRRAEGDWLREHVYPSAEEAVNAAAGPLAG